MKKNFIKADSFNLPWLDSIMVARFFAENPDFCSGELRNIKTKMSSRETYGDEAISYVQLSRENNLCIVECKVCPDKVHNKQYSVTLTVDEKAEQVVSVQCHDCIACQGGCKHSLAFLMWVHRRSEEPSCTSVQCYWKKSKPAQVGSTSKKFITTKELTKKKVPVYAEDDTVYKLFLAEAKKRKIENCELLKYQPDYEVKTTEALSLHHLCIKVNESDCDKFLNTIASQFTAKSIQLAEMETRNQHKSRLWYELRYGRITESKAYEVSRSKVFDGTLVDIIMGAGIPETKAMKKGRLLKGRVRETVEKKLGKEIQKCGLTISQQNPMLAVSPDGIIDDNTLIEIKCPLRQQTYQNYIKDGKIGKKSMCKMQVQMHVTGKKHTYFCVADPEFEKNQTVEIHEVAYDEANINDTVKVLLNFWKTAIFPLLYRSTQ